LIMFHFSCMFGPMQSTSFSFIWFRFKVSRCFVVLQSENTICDVLW
jgi:hypothetical protein